MPGREKTIEQKIVLKLRSLSPLSTMCPGLLARRLGYTLAELRPYYARLEAQGAIIVSQAGKTTRLSDVRGPFRIAAVRPSRR
jgi:hypothetical protein